MSTPKKTKFEMAVIDRVREIRLEKGFSQESIAAILNFNTSFISQVESPGTPVKYNLNHLNKIAYELGVSPKEFMPDKAIKDENWVDE